MMFQYYRLNLLSKIIPMNVIIFWCEIKINLKTGPHPSTSSIMCLCRCSCWLDIFQAYLKHTINRFTLGWFLSFLVVFQFFIPFRNYKVFFRWKQNWIKTQKQYKINISEYIRIQRVGFLFCYRVASIPLETIKVELRDIFEDFSIVLIGFGFN